MEENLIAIFTALPMIARFLGVFYLLCEYVHTYMLASTGNTYKLKDRNWSIHSRGNLKQASEESYYFKMSQSQAC